MSWHGYVAFGVAAALAIAAPALVQHLREVRLSKAGLDHAKALTADDMIQHVARICWALGYRVFRPRGEQPELDLILTDGLGHTRGVLTRSWRQRLDGPAVEAAAAAARAMHLDSALLVSVKGFTPQARAAAERLGATLWGLPELTDALDRIRDGAIAYPDPPAVNPAPDEETDRTPEGRPTAEEAPPVIPPALQNPRIAPKTRRRPQRLRPGEAWSPDDVPRCPRCGRKMVIRNGKEGEYWGCPIFPRCLGTRSR